MLIVVDVYVYKGICVICTSHRVQKARHTPHTQKENRSKPAVKGKETSEKKPEKSMQIETILILIVFSLFMIVVAH